MITESIDFKKNAKKLLGKIINCSEDIIYSNIFFTKRCNASIKYSFKSLKALGYKTVIIPKDGGWMTYEQFAKELKLNLVFVQTAHSQIELDDLNNKTKENKNSIVIMSTLAGYFVELPVKEIYKLCKKNNCVFINDVSGSIGTSNSDLKNCDIMVGSFGEGKPVDLGNGGFIAFSDLKYKSIEIEEAEFDFEKLTKRLENIENRLNFLHNKSKEVKRKILKHIPNAEILHKNENGINVLVKYHSEEEKQKIIEFCNNEKIEYTECPRYIRVLENAISIEIKRLIEPDRKN